LCITPLLNVDIIGRPLLLCVLLCAKNRRQYRHLIEIRQSKAYT